MFVVFVVLSVALRKHQAYVGERNFFFLFLVQFYSCLLQKLHVSDLERVSFSLSFMQSVSQSFITECQRVPTMKFTFSKRSYYLSTFFYIYIWHHHGHLERERNAKRQSERMSVKIFENVLHCQTLFEWRFMLTVTWTCSLTPSPPFCVRFFSKRGEMARNTQPRYPDIYAWPCL